MYTPIYSDSHKQCVSHILNTHRLSVNDVTSGILAPALQVNRDYKNGNQTKNYGGALKQTKIAVLVYLNGEISYSIVSIFLSSSNLCCVTHLEQIQFTFFHLLRFPLNIWTHFPEILDPPWNSIHTLKTDWNHHLISKQPLNSFAQWLLVKITNKQCKEYHTIIHFINSV